MFRALIKAAGYIGPASPLHFCILQAIKTGWWEGLGMRLVFLVGIFLAYCYIIYILVIHALLLPSYNHLMMHTRNRVQYEATFCLAAFQFTRIVASITSILVTI